MTLAILSPPILAALFAWWFSTGAILWLVRRPRRTHGPMLAVSAIGAVAAVAALAASAHDTSAGGAYAAFVSALAVWGWHEASFLMGAITGPRPAACPPGATGWRRFKYATLTLIHHEIFVALTAVALVAMTWGAPNQIGPLTFLVLLAMRLSAKLNIFLGVPNLTDEFFPDHLAHLKSYLPKRAMNALFPWSVIAGALLTAYLFAEAHNSAPASGEQTGFLLLGTLAALALLEHLFMVLPVQDAVLWRWAAPSRAEPQHPLATNGESRKIVTSAQD